MNTLHTAKYVTVAMYTVIWVFIGLVIAGPAAGFLTQSVAPQHVVGVDIDQGQIQPQLQSVFAQGLSLVGPHEIFIPVHNNWFFPASAGLSLSIIADGGVIYQTPVSMIQLAPFQSGELELTLQVSSSLVSQMQGKQVAIGGEMSLGAPSHLFNLTLKFPQS